MDQFPKHITEFAGLPVRHYNPRRGIVHPETTCQRVGQTCEYRIAAPDPTFNELLDGFLAKPACARLAGLVIGPWWDDNGSEETSAKVVARLVEARDRLPNLRAIFLGDITYRENEVTWIRQSDVTPLLEAFPRLEHLKVRGGGLLDRGRGRRQCLAFNPVRHEHLKSLVFESGCLPAAVTRAVAASDLPALEHLELWLGSKGHSSDCYHAGDTTVKDLAPILAGDSLPALKSLGLRNSQMSDKIAAALADSPRLTRLEALDLSLGTLSDAGALALIQSGALGHIKRLDIHYHYVSDEVLDGLKATGVDLDSGGRPKDWDEKNEDHRYIALSE